MKRRGATGAAGSMHSKSPGLSRALTAEYYAERAAEAAGREAKVIGPTDRRGRERSSDRKGMLPVELLAHLRWMLTKQNACAVAKIVGRSRQHMARIRDGFDRPEVAPAFSAEWDAHFAANTAATK